MKEIITMILTVSLVPVSEHVISMCHYYYSKDYTFISPVCGSELDKLCNKVQPLYSTTIVNMCSMTIMFLFFIYRAMRLEYHLL